MPQPSVSYACGRIGVLRRGMLHSSQLDRLMATHTYEEACRALSEIGYTSAEGADFQSAADERVRKACELIVAVSPNKQLTDCFLLRYDTHNLKVLLKSRFLAIKPEFLSACGTMKVDTLRHAVSEHRYQALPEVFQDALNALEKTLAREFDPMTIDAELDKAMYRLVFEKLKSVHVPAVKRYFTAKVDLQNYIILLRVKKMGKDAAFFAKLFLPCGSIDLTRFTKAFDEPDRLSKLLKPYGQRVYAAGIAAALNADKLPFMEKTADDYLYSIFGDTKYQTDSIDVLIAYLLAAQREATDVRLIMTGKLNGFTAEELSERVRELHG